MPEGSFSSSPDRVSTKAPGAGARRRDRLRGKLRNPSEGRGGSPTASTTLTGVSF